MTIEQRIKEYLDANFDGRIMLCIDNEFTVYNDTSEALPAMVHRFEWFSSDNDDDYYNNNPVRLFDYCLATHSFGAICTLYYEDLSGDFCKEEPW